MKNTILDFLKSKTFWAIITLQIIAVEPYVPMIKEYLPTELSYIATLVLPVAILWAKVIRDKGVLEALNTKVKSSTKEVVKKKAKSAVKKKVTEKNGEQLE